MKFSRRFPVVCALACVFALCLAAGCRHAFFSGLPSHIRTVEVHIFKNNTMHNSIEAWIARDIIDRINMDPRIRVSSRNGDALITGEVTSVRRTTLRRTTANEPGTVQIVIDVRFSFYDNASRRYIIEDAVISSADTGLSAGVFEATAGGSTEDGERDAARRLAGEIVRRTIGMW